MESTQKSQRGYDTITKSVFINASRCLKKLHLQRHPSNEDLRNFDFTNPLQASLKSAEKLGKKKFPDGFQIDYSMGDEHARKQTIDAIERKEPIIYNAFFSHDGIIASTDVLVYRSGWHLYEIKSSTSVKYHHYKSLIFQKHVADLCGLNIHSFHISFVNKNYTLNGEVNPNKLFKIQEVTKKVRALYDYDEVEKLIQAARATLEAPTAPNRELGKHCNRPHECDFKSHCWKEVNDSSILNIKKISNELWELYSSGIGKISEIPEDFELTRDQQIQQRAIAKNTYHLEKDKIRTFLGELQYPLYFLDFESLAPGTPIFQGTQPYQMLSFQYSLLKKESPESELQVFEYLADPANHQPEFELVESLVNLTKGGGSIVVYNLNSEKTVLKTLAKDFPKFNTDIINRIMRLVDLNVPFKEMWYYHPSLRRSNSVKHILSHFSPNLDYGDLEIKDGITANMKFQEMILNGENPEETRMNLLEYCKRDTIAMTVILESLEKLVNK